MSSTRKSLGRYKILGVLGKGSMGVVYKAMDPQIGKIVAIKTMNQKILEDKEMQERFYREGAILGQLQHQNIINVYNVGVDDDICYIAMEYLDGYTLESIIEQKKSLSVRKALDIVKQVCEGVDVAHQRSVIHRDLKPANIYLLNEDHVKVLDFGVAHFQNSQLTNSGVLIGTINYIAPEQITGLRVDHRVDIFSIGVILYELLSKHNPFAGRNISQTMLRVLNATPDPVEGIPESLQRLLDKALEKDREKRFTSCRQMADEIDVVTRQEAIFDDTLSEELTVSDEVHAAQQAFRNEMMKNQAATIRKAIQTGELGKADRLLTELRRLDGEFEEGRSLAEDLLKAQRKREQKRQFIAQLTHETLLQANKLMAERQYVRAIELCQNVLKEDPKNQDARVIKASCIKKIERFLESIKD